MCLHPFKLRAIVTHCRKEHGITISIFHTEKTQCHPIAIGGKVRLADERIAFLRHWSCNCLAPCWLLFIKEGQLLRMRRTRSGLCGWGRWLRTRRTRSGLCGWGRWLRGRGCWLRDARHFPVFLLADQSEKIGCQIGVNASRSRAAAVATATPLAILHLPYRMKPIQRGAQ